MSTIPVWLANSTYNKYIGSYFAGNLDCSGNIICRGTNSIWLDTLSSIKLNAATPVTISNLELATLDGIITTQPIQTQITNLATTVGNNVTDIGNLQTKTQNQTATSSLTTFSNGVTLTTGNLTLTTGNVSASNISTLTTKTTGMTYVTTPSILTSFANSVTLTSGNLTLTNGNLIISSGDLSVASTKSIICDGEFKLGSTGRISGTGLTINNSQLAYLNGLTDSIENRIVTLKGKTFAIDGYNATTDSTDIISDIYLYQTGATSRKIYTSYQSIIFDDANTYVNFSNNAHVYGTLISDYSGTSYDVGYSIADLYNKTTGISYNNGTDTTNINHNFHTDGSVDSLGGVFADGLLVLKSNATTGTSNIIMTSTATAGSYSTRQLAGDACKTSSNPMIWVCGPSGTQANALRLTSTQFQIYCNILANGVAVTPASLAFIANLSANAENSINALNTKTANQSAITTVTTYTGTHTFNSTMNLLTGNVFNINGNSRIILNSANSYFSIATGLGILTTGTIYINATELSMLDGATTNIPTAVSNNTTDISTIFNTLTQVSYNSSLFTTTIASILSVPATLNCFDGYFLNSMALTTGKFFTIPSAAGIIAGGNTITGTQLSTYNANMTKLTNISYTSPTTKITGTTWLDGPIQLKSTYVQPATGELGFQVFASTTSVSTFTSGTVKGILSFTLPIGVWLINYNVQLSFGGSLGQTAIQIGYTSANATTAPTIALINESNTIYSGAKNFSTFKTQNVSTSTTYYLNGLIQFTGTTPTISGVYTSYFEATKIA